MKIHPALRIGISAVSALLLAAAALAIGKIFRGGPVENDGAATFFEQYVTSGGPIVWFVLLPMSVVTAYLTVEHSVTIRRSRLVPQGVGKSLCEMIRALGVERLEGQLADRGDLVSAAVREAVSKSGGDKFRMKSCVTESLQDQAMRLLRKIEWVNLIGNVAPMVGLFGTVAGMIQLFNAIVISGGQPQAAQLAGGISVALVTTFWGLLIAIPALAIYGVFRNRVETLVSEAIAEAESVMPYLSASVKRAEALTPQARGTSRKPEKTDKEVSQL